jgi:hypothetical protein
MVRNAGPGAKQSAPRVAKLLAELKRVQPRKNFLRLAQFPDEPGVAEALKPLLGKPETLEALLKVRTKFDRGKDHPSARETAQNLWQERAMRPLALRVTSAFKLTNMEEHLNEALMDM